MGKRLPALRSLQERNRLVEENMALCWHIAGKVVKLPQYRGRLTLDEAASAGAVKLIRAAELFDDSLGIKFSTYACRAIKSGIIEELNRQFLVHIPDHFWKGGSSWRERAKRKGTLRDIGRCLLPVESFDPWMAERTNSGLRSGYARGAEEEAADDRSDFERLIAVLKDRPRSIVRMSFVEGLTLKEIAARLKISKQAVSSAIKKAVARLRQNLGEAHLRDPADAPPGELVVKVTKKAR